RLIGTINPNEHGFETFTQLLEANGFGESRVRGYLHDGAVQGDYRYTPNEVRYPLEMIPKDDFRRILRFLDPKIKSGGLLFAVVKLPESQPFYRLVGRVQEVTKLTSEELL
ncbi:MAG: hypothetical protein KDD53_09815, partial [Bdellovibrionales bacterium]|nr:hypothetical protein [Bdellovibrionales bacterium]